MCTELQDMLADYEEDKMYMVQKVKGGESLKTAPGTLSAGGHTTQLSETGPEVRGII